MNPRPEDRHHDFGDTDSTSELTLNGHHQSSTPTAAEDSKPFNLTMYLDFLPGTD